MGADVSEYGILHLLGSTRTLHSQLLSLFEAMPPEERTVLALAVVYGLTYRQIAARLEIEENIVKAHLRQGLTSMRHQLVAQLAVLGGPKAPVPASVDGTQGQWQAGAS